MTRKKAHTHTHTQLGKKTETGNLFYNTEIDHNMKCNGSHHGTKFDRDDGEKLCKIHNGRIHNTKGQFRPIDMARTEL
jgi:hypothetical protein